MRRLLNGSVLPMLRALLPRSLRAEAGEPLPGTLEEIATYHRLLPADPAAPALPERVAGDLDLDAVFRRIDDCASTVGQLVLYDLLRRPLADPAALAARDQLVRRLGDAELRTAVARAVSGLRVRSSCSLPHLLLAEVAARPRWWPVIPLLSALALLAIGLAFVTPLTLAGLLAVALANMAVQASYRPRIQHFVAPMGALGALIAAGRRLGALEHAAIAPETAELRALCERVAPLEKQARRFVRELSGNDLAAALVGYANLFFLLDLNSFVFGIERVRRHRDELQALLHRVGTLDALSAVAVFRESLPAWCAPELLPPGKRLRAIGLYHPLLTDPVLNDLGVEGRGLMVTGSNMAGKTTYLRAAGLGALLAQTIATVPARAWQAPPLRVETLIDRNDDLTTGKSYFLVEVEIIRELLGAAAGGVQHLFVMDEIFRGTNTRERLSASAAVLEHLNRGEHICLVATHDLELEQLLGGRWEFWHFRESFDDDALAFDYRIRPGVSSAPNALRILELSGYPPEVTESALETFRRLAR